MWFPNPFEGQYRRPKLDTDYILFQIRQEKALISKGGEGNLETVPVRGKKYGDCPEKKTAPFYFTCFIRRDKMGQRSLKPTSDYKSHCFSFDSTSMAKDFVDRPLRWSIWRCEGSGLVTL